jgi:pimeloyl-ACP methyl ester carboxylesterase
MHTKYVSCHTDTLEIFFLDEGPREGPVLFLLHGWPDDAGAWNAVAVLLQAEGFRTIIPYIRGFGPTRFLSADTVRDARAVALAQDVIDLADCLGINRFGVVGHDWGGRVSYTLAALFPMRLTKIAALAISFQPRGEFRIPPFRQARLFWYQWLMAMDAGAEAVKADPVGFARIQWETWSPAGWFTEAEFMEAAESFQNPDWVAITLNGYRSRFKWEPMDERYNPLQHQLGMADRIDIPALVIQGASDTCDEPSSSEGLEKHFTNGYDRLVLDGVGHFPMRENPNGVARAVVKHFAI